MAGLPSQVQPFNERVSQRSDRASEPPSNWCAPPLQRVRSDSHDEGRLGVGPTQPLRVNDQEQRSQDLAAELIPEECRNYDDSSSNENSAPPENEDPPEEQQNLPVEPMPKDRRWCKYCCRPLLLIIVVLSISVILGTVIASGILFGRVQISSSNVASRTIVYQNVTVLVAELRRKTPKVLVRQDCSGGDHKIEFYRAPNCDLITRSSTLHSDPISVNSTQNPTITEVQFSGQSHVYLVSSSFIDFMIETLSPTASVTLVVFDNYTSFTQYEHSSNPNTDKAILVHKFEGMNSSYTFKSEHTSTYFFALQSSENTIFNYSYNGTRLYYNFSDYTRLKCELPASSCGSKECQFGNSTNDACILAYTSVSPVLPTYAYIDTVTSESREYTQRNIGIIVAPVGAFFIIVAIVIFIVIVSCKYRHCIFIVIVSCIAKYRRCCCNCTANNEERRPLLLHGRVN